MRKSLLAVKLGLLIFSGTLNAQECGTDHVNEVLFRENPRLLEEYRASNTRIANLMRSGSYQWRAYNQIYEVPVVVHIFVDDSPLGTQGNPTDRQIEQLLTETNAYFRNTRFPNQVSANYPFKLVLAKRTPDNQPTNGIVRINLSQDQKYLQYGMGGAGYSEAELNAMSYWDNGSYYNLTIVNTMTNSSAAAYAYYPSYNTMPNMRDGAYFRKNAFIPSTIAHEVGHGLGLAHVFGDTSGAEGGENCLATIEDDPLTTGDYVADTAPTITGMYYPDKYGVASPGPSIINSCTNLPFDDIVSNVLNYGAGGVNGRSVFTQGQAERSVQHFLAYRSSLLTSLATIPPTTRSTQPLTACIPQRITGVAGLGENSGYKIGMQQFEFGSINNKSSLHYGPNPIFYTDYTLYNSINSGYTAEVSVGESYSLTLGTSTMLPVKYTIFIDYNNDGVFQESERVVNNLVLAAGSDWNTLNTVSTSISIPSTATLNTPLRMRVIGDMNSSSVSMGACDDRYRGEVEDYTVVVKDNSSEDCPTEIIAYSGDSLEGIEGSTFEITTYGIDDSSNSSLQWQKSHNGSDWIDIEGANEKTVSTQTETGGDFKETFYRLKITCTNNSIFYSSIVKRISRKNYCEAGTRYSNYAKIANITFGSLNNTTSSFVGYEDFTNDEVINLPLNSNNQFQLTLSDNQLISNFEYLVWIDLNQNGVFEDSERLGRHQYTTNSNITSSINITIPQSASLGKTRMRVRLNMMYQSDSNSTPCGISSFGQVEDYTVNITSGNETIWENGAWSNGIPTLEKEAIIKDNLVITTGELVAKKLTVEAGSLTLNTGTILKLENELVNELTADKVIFDNGAYLMQNNATALNVGNVTYKRNSTPIHRLETLMWSSPVDGQKIGEISPETLGNRFTQYDEPSNSWVAININNDFQVGEMVAFRAPNTFDNHISPTQPGRIFEGKFIGTPFNGEYSVPVTARNSSQGFNGVGNPYASLLDLDLFYSNENNQAVGIDALHFWTREKKIVNGVYEGGDGSNWITYNAMGWNDTSRIHTTINAAQGFIAKVRNQGVLKFDNSMRTVSQGNISFRNNTASKYWLELLKEDRKVNSILIGNITGSTKGYESNLDAKPMEASEGIFSLIDNDVFVIQARGEQIDENDRIALKYSISERGEYKIKLTNPLGDFGTQNIYLVDHTLNEVINLSENELYTFTSEAGSFADRFEIIYNPRLLSTSELKDVNELVVYLDQKDLNIKSNEKFVGIQVYDLVGNLVKNISNIDETNYTIKLTNNTGVLIVNVKLANGKSVSKKIILK